MSTLTRREWAAVVAGAMVGPTATALAGSPPQSTFAGVRIGNVSQVQFRGVIPSAGGRQREPLVRLRVSVEKRYKQALRQNANFYVTTQGVLGEQFLAVDPGGQDLPVLEEGAVVRGE